ncbi:MAG: hypothetical protein GF332_01145 [Candidatus Moranbacteria bacterium]|nr:hypothetical protein [Candidatus Moranbacteria bacterium]
MTKTLKIFILGIIIAIIGFGVYALKDKILFSSNSNSEQTTKTEYESKFNDLKKQTQDSENSEEQSDQEQESPARNLDNCEHKCREKIGDERNTCLKDCRQQEIDEQENKQTCADLSTEQAHTCYLKKAVNQKDESICEQITDNQYQKKCVNAVAEAIIESM